MTTSVDHESLRQDGETSAPQRRARLAPLDRSAEFLPFRRAWQLSHCQLYWMPAAAFPMPFRQRQWLLRFHQEFAATIAAKRSVKPELFLQMKVIHPDLRDTFIKTAPQFSPIIGLSRRPEKPLPPVPDAAYAEALQKGQVKYDHAALQPDYCYWFLYKKPQPQLEAFCGHGGLTTIYLKPDENNKPPQIKMPRPAQIRDERLRELIAKSDPQKVLDGAFALQSPFLKQSKELFGADLKEDPQYPGLLFILPLLYSEDYFAADEPRVKQWFSLFDFCLQESKPDKGMLLATTEDIEQELIDLLAQLRLEGLEYPE